MKTSFVTTTTAAFILAAATLTAQTSGTSHPEALDDNITVAAPQAPLAKPSPAVPMQQASAPVLREHEVPTYEAVQTAQVTTHASHLIDPNDDNSGIVTDTSSANELPEGTLVRVRLNNNISTRGTERDGQFQALLSAPIEHQGRIVIPAGSVLTGRVTDLYTGHHIGKAAGIHLEPTSITLPSGITYKMTGQVVDLTLDHKARVSQEGTIVSNDPTPGTVAAVGVTTGTGAVAGAVLGGGVGAVVGAGIGAGIGGTVWANQTTTQTLPQGTPIIFSLNQAMLLDTSNN
jgi:hypothetical protein